MYSSLKLNNVNPNFFNSPLKSTKSILNNNNINTPTINDLTNPLLPDINYGIKLQKSFSALNSLNNSPTNELFKKKLMKTENAKKKISFIEPEVSSNYNNINNANLSNRLSILQDTINMNTTRQSAFLNNMANSNLINSFRQTKGLGNMQQYSNLPSLDFSQIPIVDESYLSASRKTANKFKEISDKELAKQTKKIQNRFFRTLDNTAEDIEAYKLETTKYLSKMTKNQKKLKIDDEEILKSIKEVRELFDTGLEKVEKENDINDLKENFINQGNQIIEQYDQKLIAKEQYSANFIEELRKNKSNILFKLENLELERKKGFNIEKLLMMKNKDKRKVQIVDKFYVNDEGKLAEAKLSYIKPDKAVLNKFISKMTLSAVKKNEKSKDKNQADDDNIIEQKLERVRKNNLNTSNVNDGRKNSIISNNINLWAKNKLIDINRNVKHKLIAGKKEFMAKIEEKLEEINNNNNKGNNFSNNDNIKK